MTDTITIETYAPNTDTPHLISTETVEVPIDPAELARREAQADYDTAAQAVEDAATPIDVMEAWKALARAQTALLRAEGRLPAE